MWQSVDRDRELLLVVIAEIELRLRAVLALRDHRSFATRPAPIPPQQVERDGADGREEQGAVLDRMLFAPEADESFLHDVLRVGRRTDPLAREEHEPRSKLCETD